MRGSNPRIVAYADLNMPLKSSQSPDELEPFVQIEAPKTDHEAKVLGPG